MDAVVRQWLDYGLTFRDSYLTCWQGNDGQAIITADSPKPCTPQ